MRRLQPGLMLAEGPRQGHRAVEQRYSPQPQRPSSQQVSWRRVCQAQPLLKKESHGSTKTTEETRIGHGRICYPLSPDRKHSPAPHQINTEPHRKVLSTQFLFPIIMFCFQPKVISQAERRYSVKRAGTPWSQTGMWPRFGAIR